MGTRGNLALVANGNQLLQYNQFDSYPDGWPLDVLRTLRKLTEADPAGFRAQVASLKKLDEAGTATDEQIEELSKFANLSVATQDSHDPYVLLRECQGNLALTLESGYVCHNEWGLLDQEYAYVIDVDGDGTFTAYDGKQMVRVWPLAKLPSDEEFVAAFGREDE